jgi:diketogulonate reductase-like aldo/keto reductase
VGRQGLKGASASTSETSTTLKAQKIDTAMFEEGAGSGDKAGSITTHDKVHLVYGTAWKKDDTAKLVASAVKHGFRFIDTACQPKHYNEPGVGQGWSTAAEELGLKRSDFYLQTKYTSINGQDPNKIPYDEEASIPEQVKESLQVSLTNLKTTYLDALVMHSPFPQMSDTLAAYETMETFVDEGKVRLLGISNIYDFAKLEHIYEQVRIKPSVIQNRFYADSNFDMEIRAFCQEHDMVYQSFWTLTGNRHALATPEIRQLAQNKQLTPQTLMYAYMLTLGHHTPLDGTTNESHMKEDIEVQNRIRNGETILSPEEINHMSQILGLPE